jgi:hypothetical protein
MLSRILVNDLRFELARIFHPPVVLDGDADPPDRNCRLTSVETDRPLSPTVGERRVDGGRGSG